MMNQINRIVLNVLYRGLRVLYQKDSRVRAEMGSWAEGLSLKLVCGPGGAVLAVRKDEQHGLCRLSRAQHTDITMRFKTVEYLEAYLFPEFMSRRILREVPPRQLGMLQVYALAMLEHV